MAANVVAFLIAQMALDHDPQGGYAANPLDVWRLAIIAFSFVFAPLGSRAIGIELIARFIRRGGMVAEPTDIEQLIDGRNASWTLTVPSSPPLRGLYAVGRRGARLNPRLQPGRPGCASGGSPTRTGTRTGSGRGFHRAGGQRLSGQPCPPL